MEFFKSQKVNHWLRRVLPVLLGAAGGYGYYYFIGCTGNACPITGNPWISTAYGALIGAVSVGSWRSKSNKDEEKL